MKSLIYLIVLATLPSSGSYKACPKQIFLKPNYHRAWQFLKKMPPYMKLAGCDLEVHICERTPGAEPDDDIVGDIYLQNQKGAKQYLTLVFPKVETENIFVSIDGGPTWVKYTIYDRNYDNYDGLRQAAALDIVSLSKDGRQGLKRLSLVTYASLDHDKVLRILPAPFWSICEP